MVARARYCAFSLLPFVTVDAPFQLGPAHFASIDDAANLLGESTQRLIRTLAAQHRDGRNQPVPRSTIVYLEPARRPGYSAEERRVLDEAVTALAFLRLSSGSGFYSRYAETYQLLEFEGRTSSVRLTLVRGHAEFDIPVTSYPGRAPLGVDVDHLQTASLAATPLHALGAIVGHAGRGALPQAQAVLRSLKWFKRAHAIDMYQEPEMQLVLLAFALEALLQTPKERVSEYFRNAVAMLVPVGEVTTWADAFYAVRSAIAHGDAIAPAKFRYGPISHVEYATRIYIYCVLSRLDLLHLHRLTELKRSLWLHELARLLVPNRQRFQRLQTLVKRRGLGTQIRLQVQLRDLLRGLRPGDDSLSRGELQALKRTVIKVADLVPAGTLPPDFADDARDAQTVIDKLETAAQRQAFEQRAQAARHRRLQRLRRPQSH